MQTFFDFPRGTSAEREIFSIVGVPWDSNSTHEDGNPRAAPKAIRELTTSISLITEHKSMRITELSALDFGDAPVFPTQPEKTREFIRGRISELPWRQPAGSTLSGMDVKNDYIRRGGTIPAIIGGDHYCTVPVVEYLGEELKSIGVERFGVITFDAHLDFYDAWLGVERNSHCTVTRRLRELDHIADVVVIGARDIDIEELDDACALGLNFVAARDMFDRYGTFQGSGIIPRVKEHFTELGVKEVYVSIDIDVLDSSVAPGTGYAMPGGLSYRQLMGLLLDVTDAFNVIGFDLVEVAPNLDTRSRVTQIVAAKAIAEFMVMIQGKIEEVETFG